MNDKQETNTNDKNKFDLRSKMIIIGTLILILIFIYIIFVTVDCIRLKNSEVMTKPIITISSER